MTNKITTPVLVNDPTTAIAQLTNADLRKCVKGIISSSTGLNKNMWQLAINAHNISENKLFVDDYGSLNNFCVAIDIPKSKFSKYVNAVKVMVNRLEPDFGITMQELTYTKAYLMSTIPNDRLDEFMSLHTPAEIVAIAYSQLEALIKKFMKPTDEAIETEAETVETEAEETEGDPNKVQAVIKELKKGTFICFEWNGESYKVPFETKGA